MFIDVILNHVLFAGEMFDIHLLIFHFFYYKQAVFFSSVVPVKLLEG
jgi:hypothetical protein